MRCVDACVNHFVVCDIYFGSSALESSSSILPYSHSFPRGVRPTPLPYHMSALLALLVANPCTAVLFPTEYIGLPVVLASVPIVMLLIYALGVSL